MITFEDIQHEFRSQSERLLAEPFSRTAELIRSLVGPEADTKRLIASGWRLLHVSRNRTRAGFWQRSLWFEKRFADGNDDFVLQVGSCDLFKPQGSAGGTSRTRIGFGRSFAQALNGDIPAAVFLRELRISRETENGLKSVSAGNDVPYDIFRQAAMELRNSLSGPPATFLEDLRFQTYKLEIPDEELGPESEFFERLNAFATIADDTCSHGCRPGVVRLLLPIAAAIRQPADKEEEYLLSSFADLDLTTRFLILATECADGFPEIERSLGAWALRMASEMPETAIEMRHWASMTTLCLRQKCPLAAVYAADRALSLEPDSSDSATRLARAILTYFHSIPLSAPTAPDGLPAVIEVLMRHEGALQGVPVWPQGAYWSLLGLAMRLNGNRRETVESTLDLAFPPEAGSNPGRNLACHAAADPLLWQSFMCGAIAGWIGWTVRQLRTFPTPVLEKREDNRWMVPAKYGETQHGALLWLGLVPDIETRCYAIGETAKRLGEPWRLGDNRIDGVGSDPEVWPLSVPQITDSSDIRALRAFRWTEPGKELGILSTWAADPDDPERDPVLVGIYPIADHDANAVVSTWEWFPYANNEGGEARIRLPDGRPLRAVIPLFVGDRQTVERATPRNCYFSAVGIDVRQGSGRADEDVPAGIARNRLSAGRAVAPPMLDMCDIERGAVCFLYGIVQCVVPVGLSGCPDVLRVELEVGLPFPLPVYVRPRDNGEPGFSVGSFACGYATLLVDYFSPDEKTDEFIVAHPGAPLPEPIWNDPEWKKAAPRSLPRRDPNNADRLLAPAAFKILDLCEAYLRERFGIENVVRWQPNPRGVNFAVRNGNGTVARYAAFCREDAISVPEEVPEGCLGIVVWFSDGGDCWNLEYEEIDTKSENPSSEERTKSDFIRQ